MMAVKAHIVPAGAGGASSFADTAVHTGKWSKITAVTATVVAASQSNIAGLNGFSLAAGQSIEGIFTSITLTSGSIIAYKA